MTGFEVYDLLYKNFSIQVELGDSYNILALVSIGTNKSDIYILEKELSRALFCCLLYLFLITKIRSYFRKASNLN
ncbi:hypothetical protein BGU66_24005 [Clostridioides difficile]|nr:hypothetical protein BGU66_24005 [Clostridioides difficile]